MNIVKMASIMMPPVIEESSKGQKEADKDGGFEALIDNLIHLNDDQHDLNNALHDLDVTTHDVDNISLENQTLEKNDCLDFVDLEDLSIKNDDHYIERDNDVVNVIPHNIQQITHNTIEDEDIVKEDLSSGQIQEHKLVYNENKDQNLYAQQHNQKNDEQFEVSQNILDDHNIHASKKANELQDIANKDHNINEDIYRQTNILNTQNNVTQDNIKTNITKKYNTIEQKNPAYKENLPNISSEQTIEKSGNADSNQKESRNFTNENHKAINESDEEVRQNDSKIENPFKGNTYSFKEISHINNIKGYDSNGAKTLQPLSNIDTLIVQKVQSGNKDSVTFKLEPEHLGKMEISFDKNDNIKITVENKQAYEILQSEIKTIEKLVQEIGKSDTMLNLSYKEQNQQNKEFELPKHANYLLLDEQENIEENQYNNAMYEFSINGRLNILV